MTPLGVGALHVMNPLSGQVYSFQCKRCRRTLPENQFQPIHQFRAALWRNVPATMALHPFCNLCRKQQKGKWVKHPLYTPALDRVMKRVTASARGGAFPRRLVFAIDQDDVLGLYLKQEGRCALSGLRLDWKARRKNSTKPNTLAPSIDRIDSSGNYVLGNVQIVAVAVNLMKRDLPQEAFITICEHVYKKNRELEELLG